VSFPEPSKEVQDLKTLHQDLYEIKRIQSSLSQLPECNLRASLVERVNAFLDSGNSIDELNTQILSAKREKALFESRITQLQKQLSEGNNTVLPSNSKVGFKVLSLCLFIGYVVGLISSQFSGT
jgi:hypothetical protein